MSPYAWLTSLDGNSTLNGVKADVDASFADILDESDSVLAFNGDFHIRYNRFGLMLSPAYANLGVDDVNDGTPFEGDATSEMWFIDAAASYRIVDWLMRSTTGGEDTAIVLDAYAGVRYSGLKNEIDLDNGGSPSDTTDWVDPIIGMQSQFDLTPRWFLWTRGDVGGFGAGCDFTANASAAIGYRFTLFGHGFAARVGYRGLFQDYDQDSGDERFEWDVTTHGPTLGVFSYWG